ncbi:hypothetical protein GA830_00985 [Mesorhizobium sp. NBSH29]|uniref:hypothetical protein n=1 Tax=Mesorhizobium sp. NBSH29 TaxID=2654249 RepID=UPI0018966886|nr:hypothetical protein [Mesorhizobium sp. NBSH29]QPC85474.1 hypothetical protein GA830_00985 [Mesorhizobium sp. NBSH29]
MSMFPDRNRNLFNPSERKRAVARPKDSGERIIDTAEDTREGSGNTLLPMLIGGLVMIVIGAIVVMTFV